MLELIAVLHVSINAIASMAIQRKLDMPAWLPAATAAFAAAWLVVMVGWLEWALFVEIGAAIGSFIVLDQWRNAKRILHVRESFAFENAKAAWSSVKPSAQRKPFIFYPNAKRLGK